MKWIFGLFLIAHALVHTSFISKQPPQQPGAPEWPFDITRSWILTPLGVSPEALQIIGVVLTLAVTIGFVASGLGWLGVPLLKSFWVPLTIFSSVTSIILLIIFWHNWFIVGPLIDLVILYVVFFRNLRP